MNILFVAGIYPGFGGVERVSNTIIEYLGTSHRIYSLAHEAIEGADIPGHLTGHHIFKSKDSEEQAAEYNRLTDELKIDIVINQGMYRGNNEIIFNKDRNRNIKVISFLHGMPGYEKTEYLINKERKDTSIIQTLFRRVSIKARLNSGFNRRLRRTRKSYRLATSQSDRTILLSPSYIKPFIKEYSLKEWSGKIGSIPNPLPQSLEALPVPEWQDKENMIVFVGRLSSEKRVDIVLKVWKLLSETNSADDTIKSWKLVIVGDGEDRNELEKLAQKLQIRNCVFAGISNEVHKYFSKAKISLLTSKFEGLPMTLIESQAFGCVPVSFDISSGVRDIIVDKTGILVRQDDIDAMACETARLMKDEPVLKQYSRNAVTNSRRYSIDTIGPVWTSMLDDVAGTDNRL